ncbi:hypothetical protein NNJEOMEG_02983 [Fundidesulfovibrio magnetotacticus]|uniref:GAF domain-containing protein n=1 Tax=Fundidesulfovibrio magnetotacticus TaxID=2730080 RepID=A0A6V8M3Z9_9BACT|nr:GAF domain-containing protein [Fundidesulfovibrio magnetotacticus]GFK95125.1 hypothetical protein NNJEOMEG_02983 [Fundidesulfovibrio magnetotacticus]
MKASIAPTRAFESAFKQSFVLETFLGLGLLAAVNVFWFREAPAFCTFSPHPYFIVVLPIATRYGFRAGVFSAMLATAFYLAFLLPTRPDISPIDLRSWEYWGPPLLFMAAGVVLGEIRESANRETNLLRLERDDLSRELTHLTKQYQALSMAKEAMDLSVITQEQTLSLLYESSQGLRTLAEGEVYPAVLELLARYAGADAGSIYLLDDGELRLKSALGEVENRPETLPPDKGLAEMVLDRKRAVTLNACTAPEQACGHLLAAAPLLTGSNQAMGILAIESIPFHKLTPQAIRVLSLLADWCSSSVLNARTYLDTKNQLIADDVTKAYTFQFFLERVEEEYSRARRYKLPLSMLLLRIEDWALIPDSRRLECLALVCQVVRGIIRKIDLLFRHERPDQLILLLPCTPGEGATVVARKFSEQLAAFHYEIVPGSPETLRVAIALTQAGDAHDSGISMLRQTQSELDGRG